jgi:hypothetical protein
MTEFEGEGAQVALNQNMFQTNSHLPLTFRFLGTPRKSVRAALLSLVFAALNVLPQGSFAACGECPIPMSKFEGTFLLPSTNGVFEVQLEDYPEGLVRVNVLLRRTSDSKVLAEGSGLYSISATGIEVPLTAPSGQPMTAQLRYDSLLAKVVVELQCDSGKTCDLPL